MRARGALKTGGLKRHPLVIKLVDRDVLEKMGAARLGADQPVAARSDTQGMDKE
ncbi:MAG: hypothetical protein AAFR17_01975 [Pseudomonadota bacterium]